MTTYTPMSNLPSEELADLGSTQLNSLEVHKTPVTEYDVAIKSYVDSKFSTAEQLVIDEKTNRSTTDSELSTTIDTEKSERKTAISTLDSNKLAKSTQYSGGTSENFKINNDAYLYIGNLWRITANTNGASKKLEFQYSSSGLDKDFKTAVPFIRHA